MSETKEPLGPVAGTQLPPPEFEVPTPPATAVMEPPVDTAVEGPTPFPAEAEEAAPEGSMLFRLHRMVLAGFKSFCDRTDVRFPVGITAVVGPNGCGKSNLGDAINWVLGEQSPKMLRGRSMQDVIFAGTEGRRAVGTAEVSLHLTVDGGDFPEDERESVVTRRLYRSGESEYLLNGKRARLKDILELLRRAHVGAKTYATIEQGRIEQILNAKPRDRRLIIEDAAGISGFKHKRRLSELKLEATQANLLRVSDIVNEVRRQINSLKRQASKARRYQRLREELRSKERVRFGARARAMEAGLSRLRSREGSCRQAEAEAAARLAGVEAELSSEREAIEEADRGLREAVRTFHQLEGEIQRKEDRIRTARERAAEAEETASRLSAEGETLQARRVAVQSEIRANEERVEAGGRGLEDLESRLSEKQGEMDEASARLEALRARTEELRRGLFDSMNRAADRRNRRRSIEEAIERSVLQGERLTQEQDEATSELDRLRRETATLAEQVAALEQEMAGLRESHERAEREAQEARARHAVEVEALAAAREEEKSASARLRTLEDVSTRFAGVSDGVRMLLTSGRSAGVRTAGVVADFIEAGPEVESAAELYLGGVLPAVVVMDDADASRAADLLRSEKAGRTWFLSRTQPSGAPAVGTSANGRQAISDELLRDRRVLGRLSDYLKLKTASNGFIADRIGDAIVVDTLESALALHRVHPGVDYLTASGDVVYASGIVAAGGRHASDHGLLAHKRKTQEARALLAESAARASAAQQRVDAGRTEIERLEASRDSAREALEETGRRLMEAEMRGQRAREESQRAARRVEVLAQERANLERDAGTLDRERGEAVRLVEEAERDHGTAEQRLAVEVADLDRLERTVRQVGDEVAALRAEVAVHRHRQETASRQRSQLGEALTELEGRIEAARQGAEDARRRAAEAVELRTRTETEIAVDLREREEQSGRVAEREREIAERRRALGDREAGQRSLRAELETRRRESSAAEVELARGEADRRHLDDLCRQELGCTADEAAEAALEALGDADALEGADLEQLETESAEIRGKIERIGPVNMMAIEEFSELEERYAFLVAQQKDLEQSIDSLKETIRRINRTSRERFTSAFEAIRRNYQEIFQVLFNGGRADLRLEEDEDVLECGIEILAQPPGKRLGSIQLLSGGEKSMAAIALLFAIFRHQPSPFCLLDEVDAALDDVNIGRFTRMLREYADDTQFILITHNKLSMDAANLLYGVTMEEPGVSKVVSLQLH